MIQGDYTIKLCVVICVTVQREEKEEKRFVEIKKKKKQVRLE